MRLPTSLVIALIAAGALAWWFWYGAPLARNRQLDTGRSPRWVRDLEPFGAPAAVPVSTALPQLKPAVKNADWRTVQNPDADADAREYLQTLTSGLQAIEAENLEVMQEFDDQEGSPGIYLFTAPSEEQVQRMRAIYERFPSGIDQADALRADAQKILESYLYYPEPYKIVTVGRGDDDQISLTEMFFSEAPELNVEGGSATLTSSGGHMILSTARQGPFSDDTWAVQRYGPFLPPDGE